MKDIILTICFYDIYILMINISHLINDLCFMSIINIVKSSIYKKMTILLKDDINLGLIKRFDAFMSIFP